MSNLQKRKLKVLVGQRQRARIVRQFLDQHLTLTINEESNDESAQDIEASNVPFEHLDLDAI
jgi:hypothetical protein